MSGDPSRGYIRLEHDRAPIAIIVSQRGRDYYSVDLKVESDIIEFVEEFYGGGVKEALEEFCEEIESFLDYISAKLESSGYRVSRDYKSAVLDIYDMLEEAEEAASA